ncbi:MAG: TM0106 family RecB-like putative nuclease [Patescibacteria group bacterium]
MNKIYFTASDIFKYFRCPHWVYFDYHSTTEEKALKRDFSEVEIKRMEDGLAHEKQVVTKLFEGKQVVEVPRIKDAEKDCAATLELMKQGVEYIYQGTLTEGDWTGRPDILERHEGESNLGAWHYIPIDVKSSHSLEKYQIMQLVFYSVLLEKVQGRFPARTAILNKDGERLEFEAADHLKEFEHIAAEISEILAGVCPDPVLRKTCYETGPWGLACERLARMNNDIAQLYNVDVRKLRALRSLGVRTVDDAAEMDPQALDGVAPGLRMHGLEVAKRQAQSLKEKLVIVREKVSLPDNGLEIHFDIESDPPNDVDYLYGFLLREPTGDRYVPFVAKTLEQEGDMWKSFLAWIETLPPEYTVYHFASYEKTRLRVLEDRYGGSEWLNKFRERMVDLKEITNSGLIFPLYFYGLKYIAKFLGYSWKGEVKGGGQSVDVFEKYLENKDEKILQSIIQYNEEDVRATAFLKDWLVKFAKEITSYEKPYPWVS